MKIGFDISALSLPKSGVGNYQLNLLNALFKMDRENRYCLYAFNFRNRDRFSSIDFKMGDFELNVVPVPQRLITVWWLLSDFPTLETIAGDCDLYQVSELCIQPVKKAKTVAFVHDLTTILFPEFHVSGNVFLHKTRFKRLSKTDAVLTNSEHTKKDIVEHLGISPDKIFVTHLGADDSFRPMPDEGILPVLKKYNLIKPYLLFVGTLEPRKNIPALISAFNILKAKQRIPHQLILAGQKGWKYHEVFRAIEESPFAEDIRYLGYAEDGDLPALMSGCSAFVYPSFYEGFGLPVLEAMQCGAPVVTSATSSLSEVGGEACLYADPCDPGDLADQIYTILSDPVLRKDLSGKGIARAKNFSWEKCARETLEVYRAVFNN